MGDAVEIKYLKDAPLGKKGDVATVQDYEAKALITLGFAKAVKKNEPKLLLNPNGTPVIDDFGGQILANQKSK